MNTDVRDNICNFQNLYKAMRKCRTNVLWKDSVAGFVKNGLVNCYDLRRDLLAGTYTISQYTVFKVYEPKERMIVSTRIRDRVFQRSMCDNYLTQQISKSFIYDSGACQVNKGPDFTISRLKVHMQKFYRKHKLNGYVLKCDLSNYFGSTPHSVAIAAVKKRVPDGWVVNHVETIINSFTQGPDPNIGMGLGSQVTQLVELAVLDDLDHYIKEQLHIKHYVRYMDDFILIHEDKEYLKYCKHQIDQKISESGLTLNSKKTQIFRLNQPLKFLGFSFKMTETGKIYSKVLPDKANRERNRLKKLSKKVRSGQLDKKYPDCSFDGWVNHASKGTCYGPVYDMTKFYEELWR